MAIPSKPKPTEMIADGLDLPFWEAAADHRLVIYRCQDCGKSYWPATVCADCPNSEMRWVEASGRGEVFTYTVYHRPFNPAWQKDVPYNVAVIELEEGPLMFTNIVGIPNDQIKIGMPVEVTWEDREPGVSLPQFKPRG